MVGAEIATIAAAESSDPERAVAKAANSVILRIAIFFVGSIFLLVTILPWNGEKLAASPFVSAFTEMGIPYADHIMNAVVLTAVLSCLNSGMYTASRMLFVSRRAPRGASPAGRGDPSRRTGGGDPGVLGRRLLCVIAAAVSPDTIFAFLLNSSGAIILFVYLLIAISQIVLRYRTDESKLKVKMWLFPVLSILTAVAILAILVQMGIQKDVRSQLVLSLLSWAVVLVFYFANKWFIARRPAPAGVAATAKPHRVLVLANETANSGELLDELRRIGADTAAKYFVVVPASPIETGVAATHGPLDLAEATQQAAQQRLDYTLTTLRSDNLDADGALGDYRPLRALAKRRRHVPPGSDRDRDVAARIFRVAPFRRRGPRTCRVRRAGHARRGHPGRGGTERAMTILAGVSSSRQGRAPLNLAAQISRNTGDKIIATAIVERPWPTEK